MTETNLEDFGGNPGVDHEGGVEMAEIVEAEGGEGQAETGRAEDLDHEGAVVNSMAEGILKYVTLLARDLDTNWKRYRTLMAGKGFTITGPYKPFPNVVLLERPEFVSPKSGGGSQQDSNVVRPPWVLATDSSQLPHLFRGRKGPAA